jgi:hypothetical protein
VSTPEHFTTQELLDYADQTAEAALQGRIREHLSGGCTQCLESMEEWSRITDGLEGDREYSVPNDLRQAAFALFAPREMDTEAGEKVYAVVTFDSRTAPTLSETRSNLQDSFRLVCEAGNVKVDLLCEHNANLWSIAGGILTDPDECRTWTVSCLGVAGELELDAEDGFEFVIDDLPPGAYSVSLNCRTQQICLPDIELPSTNAFLN